MCQLTGLPNTTFSLFQQITVLFSVFVEQESQVTEEAAQQKVVGESAELLQRQLDQADETIATLKRRMRKLFIFFA